MHIPEFDASPNEIRAFAMVQVVLVAVLLALMFWAFGGRDGDLPTWWLIVPLLAAPALAAFFCERVWLDGKPLDPTDASVQERAVSAYAGQTLMKLYLCTAAIVFSIIVGFLFRQFAGWPIVIGGVPSFAVLAFEIWPSLRNISMAQVMLDSKGAQSGLADSFLRA